MCNLNILISKKKNVPTLDIINNYIGAINHSYNNNSDGIGQYFSNNNKKITSKYNINLLKELKNFRSSRVLINHTRLTTSGHEAHNIQPFCKNKYVFVHNGILSNYIINSKDSDSLQFFNKFLELVKTGISDIEAIKETFKKQKYYSIFIYNTETKKMYYFKSTQASISINIIGNSYLFITTNKDNLLYFEKYTTKPIVIEDYTIYEITTNFNFIYQGQIEKEEFIPCSYDYKYNTNYKKYNSKKYFNDYKDYWNEDI